MSQLWSWICGDGRWGTIPQCLDYDPVMVSLVVFSATVLGALFVWIATYWNKFRILARSDQSTHIFLWLTYLFAFIGIAGGGLTTLCCWYPAWRLWILFVLIQNFCFFKLVRELRLGVVFVFKDLATLRQIRKEFQLVQTSKLEFDALRDKLCEVQNLVQR